MPTWTVDFKDLQNTIDEMFKSRMEDKPETEQSSQSDLTAKYKKLYEASISLETLKNRREALLQAIVKIDLEIEELNKLFSN
jgi:predicted RNase H-like nuclease (RuvC/YqgF family)